MKSPALPETGDDSDHHRHDEAARAVPEDPKHDAGHGSRQKPGRKADCEKFVITRSRWCAIHNAAVVGLSVIL